MILNTKKRQLTCFLTQNYLSAKPLHQGAANQLRGTTARMTTNWTIKRLFHTGLVPEIIDLQNRFKAQGIKNSSGRYGASSDPQISITTDDILPTRDIDHHIQERGGITSPLKTVMNGYRLDIKRPIALWIITIKLNGEIAAWHEVK